MRSHFISVNSQRLISITLIETNYRAVLCSAFRPAQHRIRLFLHRGTRFGLKCFVAELSSRLLKCRRARNSAARDETETGRGGGCPGNRRRRRNHGDGAVARHAQLLQPSPATWQPIGQVLVTQRA